MKNQTTPVKTILPILKYGDPILRKKAELVTDFSSLPQMAEQMFDTMYEERGIGLAANQVGWCINLLVMDTSNMEGEEGSHPYVFINSEIIKTEGSVVIEEGCLSVPEIRAEIKRPETIILRYHSFDQTYQEETFTGLDSRVIQHELDHLKGKLFVDYLSPAKRMLINKRLLEISKAGRPTTGIIL